MNRIDTAPRDGTLILVFHGARQVSERAFWNRGFQGWTTRDLRVLHGVSWWEAL